MKIIPSSGGWEVLNHEGFTLGKIKIIPVGNTYEARFAPTSDLIFLNHYDIKDLFNFMECLGMYTDKADLKHVTPDQSVSRDLCKDAQDLADYCLLGYSAQHYRFNENGDDTDSDVRTVWNVIQNSRRYKELQDCYGNK